MRREWRPQKWEEGEERGKGVGEGRRGGGEGGEGGRRRGKGKGRGGEKEGRGKKGGGEGEGVGREGGEREKGGRRGRRSREGRRGEGRSPHTIIIHYSVAEALLYAQLITTALETLPCFPRVLKPTLSSICSVCSLNEPSPRWDWI